MSYIKNFRIPVALGAIALVAALAPSAQAANVCNEAGNGNKHQGAYTATDPDPNPPARFKTNRGSIGDNKGLNNAASHSPALSVCGPDGGSGGDGGSGDGDGSGGGGDGGGGISFS